MFLYYFVTLLLFEHITKNNTPMLSSLLKISNSIFSPAGSRGRLTILFYHRVWQVHDPMYEERDCLPAEKFDSHLSSMLEHFNVLPLPEALEKLRSGSLPTRAAAITFDDGYADNINLAYPILAKHNLHATFFITTGFLNDGLMWNDTIIETIRLCDSNTLNLTSLELGCFSLNSWSEKRIAAAAIIGKLKYHPLHERLSICDQIVKITNVTLPTNLMMTNKQVRELHNTGMEIGAHTINHPILSRLSDNEAEEEITKGKSALENIVAAPVNLFAYPNGRSNKDYNTRDINIVKRAGFHAAFSTEAGVAHKTSDLYQIPRFSPWDSDERKFIFRLSQNLINFKSS